MRLWRPTRALLVTMLLLGLAGSCSGTGSCTAAACTSSIGSDCCSETKSCASGYTINNLSTSCWGVADGEYTCCSSGEVCLLSGNSDRSTVVTHSFNGTVTAKYVRFYPTSVFGSVGCMRVELYNAAGAVGVGVNSGSSHTLSASSEYAPQTHLYPYPHTTTCCPAGHGRLDYTAGEAWCPLQGETVGQEYLQVTLDSTMDLIGVATQGNGGVAEGASTYELQISEDGTTWTNVCMGDGSLPLSLLSGTNPSSSGASHLAAPTVAIAAAIVSMFV